MPRQFPFALIFILTFLNHSLGSVDKTKQPKAHGKPVIQAAIKRIQDSCIFSNDHQFLRRIAWVETQYGNNPSTFLNGRLNGVWRLDQTAFGKTQNASAFAASKWQQFVTSISNQLYISYTNISYARGDMLVPLYDTLATRFYLEYVAEKTKQAIPYTVTDQANYWSTYFNGGRGYFNATAFVNMVNSIPAVCNAAGADILFILDSSGSIGITNFRKVRQFVQAVVSQPAFTIGPKAYKFAVDSFSGKVISQVKFNGYNNNLTQLLQQIGQTAYLDDGTNTDLALYHALYVSFNTSSGQGARDPNLGYPRIAIVITDGQSNNPTRTKIAATVVKQNGLAMFTVGVGNAFNDPAAVAEIRYIASYPKCMRLYMLQDFDKLLQGFTAELKAQTCQTSAVVVPTHGSIKNSIKKNQYLYFTFKANATYGITFQVAMTTGSVTLYLSLTVRNPSEVEYDFAVNATIGNGGNVYIPPSTLVSIQENAEIGTLLMENVLLAQEGATNNFTNATIPVYGSLKGTSQNNNFTLKISQGNNVPSTTPAPPTRPSTAPPGPGYMLQVYLEFFDNSAGGGMLYSTRKHCDPFWFTGLDQCDMAMKICVEPIQALKNVSLCSTGWIDLGQVTTNNNIAKFGGGQIGGWTNPMIFKWNINWAGFQIKYMVADVDMGSMQIVDKNICPYRASRSNQGVLGCSHTRPNGLPTSFRVAFLKK